jgi:hypothetical protein
MKVLGASRLATKPIGRRASPGGRWASPILVPLPYRHVVKTDYASGTCAVELAPPSWFQRLAPRAGRRASKAISLAPPPRQFSNFANSTQRETSPKPCWRAVRLVAIKRKSHPAPSLLETHLAPLSDSRSTDVRSPSGAASVSCAALLGER